MWYTVSQMKQRRLLIEQVNELNRRLKGKKGKVSEEIWDTFDVLFKTVNRQNRRVEELEKKVVELERKLSETNGQAKAGKTFTIVNEMPAEKAA